MSTRAPRGALAVVALLALGTAQGVTAPLTEAQVRAGLLYNFATFVEWPDAQNAQQRPFVIGVVGSDAVGEALAQIQGRAVKGRPLAIRQTSRDARSCECQILYVPGKTENWEAILARINGAPVLTVGEHPQFIRLGGVIRLYAEESRVRFEINVSRSQQVQLQISSKLLGLAKVLREP